MVPTYKAHKYVSMYIRKVQRIVTSDCAFSQSPLPKNTTGLTPRLRDGAHLRPYANMFKKLKNFVNCLYISGSKSTHVSLNP
jgi:hypothetical protein